MTRLKICSGNANEVFGNYNYFLCLSISVVQYGINTAFRLTFKAVADVVTVELFLGEETPDEFADRLFEEADENKDGKITFEEFQKAAEHNDTLVNMLLPAPV
ncbi:hypothetical protein DPMN_081950 [Dreissena polymorpha]|uniref:EF-hand domain-containing protein n=1 Tax=Dreissena polymorpha TaxID=45954 RepID=A0A9D4BGY6_DREPO|nr:hypothetical protein DPMN_081889 [Dreissena polymorpha]KAH3694510.1 hypothetical protein DPMN_081950 [Dreissena polymorpha]